MVTDEVMITSFPAAAASAITDEESVQLPPNTT